jgi:hypothetical protein
MRWELICRLEVILLDHCINWINCFHWILLEYEYKIFTQMVYDHMAYATYQNLTNGLWPHGLRYLPKSHKWFMITRPALLTEISQMVVSEIELTLVILNSMGPWTKFESTVVRLKRSYENTGSVVCLTTKGRQLERNFEELKPASHGLVIINHLWDFGK